MEVEQLGQEPAAAIWNAGVISDGFTSYATTQAAEPRFLKLFI